MDWKCPRCGTGNEKHIQTCHGMCGYIRYGRLILVSSTGEEIRLNLDGPVGKALLRRVVGEDSRFASEPQFYLNRCEDNTAWLIKQEARAVNDTLVNGVQVTEAGTKLTSGDEVTVGKDKARLRVRIEF